MFCEKCGKEIPDSTKFCPYFNQRFVKPLNLVQGNR